MQFCLDRAPDGRYSLQAAEDCIDEVRSAYSDAVLTQSEYMTVVGTEEDGFAAPCGAALREGAADAPGAGDACDPRTNPCTGDELICAPDPSGSGNTCQTFTVHSGGADLWRGHGDLRAGPLLRQNRRSAPLPRAARTRR